MSETLNSMINRQIANASLLYVKLHHFHWYVKGPQFFTLHAKFEELYTEAAQTTDALAERLLALGGKPISSLQSSLNEASIREADGGETAERMVEAAISDFSVILDELKEGMKTAAAEGDETTEDLLLGIHAGLEKHIWMLNSFLGN